MTLSMIDIVHGVRSSFRLIRRRPFYCIAVVLILTLGLSSTMAVFTYMNGFYQPFPGVDAHGLVRLFEATEQEAFRDISYLDFLDYRVADEAFEGFAATQLFYAASVRRETMTEVAFLEAVSGGYFSVLGIRTALGRALSTEDDRPGADPAVVLSHSWWQSSFNGDSSVIGTTLYLNFRPFTVVGVASPEFRGTDSGFRPHVWIPFAPFKDRYISWAARAEDRDVPLVRVYGRLRAGAGEERGLEELQRLAIGLDEAYPRQTTSRRLRLDAATWIDPRARLAEQSTVRLMMVAAAVLLLLVCANVTNLLLSLAAGRRHEISMRAALGASPGRILREVLAENVLLSVPAGVIALLVTGPASARLGSYFARPSVWGEHVSREATIDVRVVLFALAISLIAGLIAGLLPAIRARRRNIAEALTTQLGALARAPRRVWGRRVPDLQDGLVAMQVALSVVLLVVAGLVIRTMVAVGDLDPGFPYDHLVVTHISTSSTTLEPGERDRFFRELARRVADEPWARSATVADFPLLFPHGSAELRIEGRPDRVAVVHSKVIPGFFEALGIQVTQGRSFGFADTASTPGVAMVNEKMARRFFAAENPVGRRIWWSAANEETERDFEIIGVVRDTKTQDLLTEADPVVYFSYPQHDYPTGSALLVSARGDPAAAVPLFYRWLREYEPHLAIINVVPYNEVVRGFLYTHRMNAELFSAVAFLGLALAAVGIFSVVSLAVSRRTREIGIRTAIGARRGDLRRMVIARAMTPVMLGLAAGLAASFAASGLVQSLLFGVQPHDPLALAAGAGLLLLVALSAAYVPARRAMRVDPATALRHE